MHQDYRIDNEQIPDEIRNTLELALYEYEHEVYAYDDVRERAERAREWLRKLKIVIAE